ncbi:MFS transporter [Niabella ginsenosidivorans]|uniref:Nitrate/nitrite transporter n=1 Tax=Niabella ginsenosidivorans TaxID=1176587 RepID=A0A1A9HZ79_9BACT|nr:NarK family nitrate/nitrite MFS transporter [Niabella ginsenosidivorans]ANH79780.1 MFS transporter [Niabella ginsenosidivorans]
MTSSNAPLTKLNIFSLKGAQMRTFHITWFTFFICFFGWFGLAPLMPTIKEDLHLSKSQIGNIVIASVSGTIIARLIIGRLCDSWGPRKTYTALLLCGALPVMCVGLSKDYTTFLLFRLAISVIGASFVITQFHTSVMFAPNIKGTANAIAGGWGNLGGGITNMLMPLVFAAIVGLGYTQHQAWRYAMLLPGLLMILAAFLYYRYTKDTPEGNYGDSIKGKKSASVKTDYSLLKDWRIWALSLAYAMGFGMEITFDNVAALHFVQEFRLSQAAAGFWAGVFGLMNLFARALGGIFADKIGKKQGMKGKGIFLAVMLLFEGIGLLLFAKAPTLPLAVTAMISFALFLKMVNGATYAMTPFINIKNIGLISGIVGAGGNLGGMLFGFLFKSNAITYSQAFSYIGLAVIATSFIVLFTRFGKQEAATEKTATRMQPATVS